MRNVYVLGTGMIKFGRYPDKTVPQLGGQAAILALKDAGIGIKDVEMFACGNLYAVQRDGRTENPAADWPDRNPGNQRRQRMRHRLDGVSRGVHVGRGRDV